MGEFFNQYYWFFPVVFFIVVGLGGAYLINEYWFDNTSLYWWFSLGGLVIGLMARQKLLLEA